MSRFERGQGSKRKAVALQYGSSNAAPMVVASGMGYLAEKIVEAAQDHGVPIYEDNSLATALTQLKLGQEIPEELYQAIVEIYVYFLKFDPSSHGEAPQPGNKPGSGQEPKQKAEQETEQGSEETEQVDQAYE